MLSTSLHAPPIGLQVRLTSRSFGSWAVRRGAAALHGRSRHCRLEATPQDCASVGGSGTAPAHPHLPRSSRQGIPCTRPGLIEVEAPTAEICRARHLPIEVRGVGEGAAEGKAIFNSFRICPPAVILSRCFHVQVTRHLPIGVRGICI